MLQHTASFALACQFAYDCKLCWINLWLLAGLVLADLRQAAHQPNGGGFGAGLSKHLAVIEVQAPQQTIAR